MDRVDIGRAELGRGVFADRLDVPLVDVDDRDVALVSDDGRGNHRHGVAELQEAVVDADHDYVLPLPEKTERVEVAVDAGQEIVMGEVVTVLAVNEGEHGSAPAVFPVKSVVQLLLLGHRLIINHGVFAFRID